MNRKSKHARLLELDRRIQEVVDTYEHSTSWRITKPIRAIGNFLGR